MSDMPQMLPLWHPKYFQNIGYTNFQGMNPMGFNFNNNFGIFNGYNNSTKSNSQNDSIEEIIRRKNNSTNDEIKNPALKYEIETTQNELKEIEDEISKRIEYLEKLPDKKTNTVENSKIEIPQITQAGQLDKEALKPKKKGLFEKVINWGSSAASALTNIGKAIIGIDKDGKWQPKQALKNAAITIGASALCFVPVVGPYIGATLLASGVVSGAIGIGKGISNLNKADTELEKEQARQDICSGAFVGITSALGLKGLGKSFRVATSTTPTAASRLATSKVLPNISSVAKTRTSFSGKLIQKTSQFTRDITINPLRAAKANSINQAKELARYQSFTGNGTLKSGAKITTKNIKTAFKKINNFQTKYNNKYSNMEKTLEAKIENLNKKLYNETNIDARKLIKEEQNLLKANLDDLHKMKTFKTKAEFDNLKTNNSAAIKNTKFKADQEAFLKDLKNLIEMKEASMRTKSRFWNRKKNKTELEQYISVEKRYRTLYDTQSKVKTRIKELKQDIINYDVKLTDTTLSDDAINLIKTNKANAEAELAILKNIRHKSVFKPSTLLKNDYMLAIGGSNPSSFFKLTKNALVTPAMSGINLKAQNFDKNYSILFSTELSNLTKEEKEENIKTLKQIKENLKTKRNGLKDASTTEELEKLKAGIWA